MFYIGTYDSYKNVEISDLQLEKKIIVKFY